MKEAKERGWSTATVFLDVRKAFDTFPHDTIFTALQNLGITARFLSYIPAFVTERTLRVRVGNTYSTPRGITAGVPQGSVLSPLLFSIAIASLPSAAGVGA